MIVEMQGYLECGLATAAAVVGQPLAKVREVALKAAGASHWANIVSNVYDDSPYELGIKAVYKEFMPEAHPEYVRNLFGRRRTPPCDIRILPDKGRGAVRLAPCHIIPWENGLVHGVGDEEHGYGWQTLDAYLARSPGMELAFILEVYRGILSPTALVSTS